MKIFKLLIISLLSFSLLLCGQNKYVPKTSQQQYKEPEGLSIDDEEDLEEEDSLEDLPDPEQAP